MYLSQEKSQRVRHLEGLKLVPDEGTEFLMILARSQLILPTEDRNE